MPLCVFLICFHLVILQDIRNTVGNIPMEWYRQYKHIGYDVEGRRLIKPQQGDQLDDFLSKVDDPNYW